MTYLPIDTQPYIDNLAEIYNDDILNVIKTMHFARHKVGVF